MNYYEYNDLQGYLDTKEFRDYCASVAEAIFDAKEDATNRYLKNLLKHPEWLNDALDALRADGEIVPTGSAQRTVWKRAEKRE